MTLKLLAALFTAAFAVHRVGPGDGGDDVMISVEDVMDGTIDDLDDLPPFEVPPKGHYKLSVSLERKEINEVDCVEAEFTVLDTLELANTNDTPSAPGTKFSTLFQIPNKFGRGNFKELLKPMSEGLGLAGKKISEVVGLVKNVEITATIKHRKDKEDKDRFYANVVNVELV